MSNMLSSLKNAAMAKKPAIEIVYSSQCENVAKVLKEKGFISEVKVFKPASTPFKMLHLGLAHDEDVYNISDIRRISKPGRRVFRKSDEIKKVAGGLGVSVVSTSKGVMEGSQAKSRKLGGEVICEVQ